MHIGKEAPLFFLILHSWKEGELIHFILQVVRTLIYKRRVANQLALSLCLKELMTRNGAKPKA